jgi:hypothetical protein
MRSPKRRVRCSVEIAGALRDEDEVMEFETVAYSG